MVCAQREKGIKIRRGSMTLIDFERPIEERLLFAGANAIPAGLEITHPA
jgi:hypothetical protein